MFEPPSENDVVFDASTPDGAKGRPHANHVPTQPPGSRATIERSEEGVVITCSPLGAWKAATTFSIGTSTCVASALVTIPLCAGIFSDMMERQFGLWLALVAGSGVAVLVVGLTVVALFQSRMYTTLAVAGGRLLMAQVSPFGRKVKEWSAEDLERITLGPYADEHDILELQIVPEVGKIAGLLSHYDDSELKWIAYELSLALRLDERLGPDGAPRAKRDAAGGLVMPEMSRLTVHSVGGGVHLEVAPAPPLVATVLAVGGVLFLVLAVMAIFSNVRPGFNDTGFLFAIVWVLLVITGVGMSLGSWVALRRRYEITVRPSRLDIVRLGTLGTKHFGWKVEDLEQIGVVDSLVQVSTKPLKQISIVTSGRVLWLLTGHSKEDLAFVAETLRDTLGIGSESREEESFPFSRDAM